METILNYIVILLNTLVAGAYCWLIYKQRIQPTLAMWVFFLLAIGISLITYLSDGSYSPMDNILNTTDLLMVFTIVVFIVFKGGKASRFNRFDLICLVAVLAIIGFWLITQAHVISNIAVQSIMVIAYFPVIRRMLSANKNTEPISVWIGMFAVAAISLLTNKGALADVYAWRAVFCTGLLTILMVRIEYKNKNQKRISSTV